MSKVFTVEFFTEDGRSTEMSIEECTDKSHAIAVVLNMLRTLSDWIHSEDGAIKRTAVCSFVVKEGNE